eukprot:CAMPEP_0118863620 /NCGR_PEP_ID=MMETSP1163-20130328/8418_1 /TAXON_ID=124430 /ORGANISM="Phaeomonas parva, Strain CCMP2877" /LENGTH=316 /DNA_ID=CAMNT_0006797643 /DNA_START=151 /DNA_END=1097 /DNA_ORIENTATION=-
MAHRGAPHGHHHHHHHHHKTHGDFVVYCRLVKGGGNRVRVACRAWETVLDLKRRVGESALGAAMANVTGAAAPPPERLRLFCRGRELVAERSLMESDVRRHDLVYVARHTEEEVSGDGAVLSLHMSDTVLGPTPPPALVACFEAARAGIAAGHAPVLSEDGTGGTYFFPDGERKFVAAFKPGDEEPFCVNNPRGYARREGSDESMRTGIRPGEAHYREVAAYFCDHGGFTGVPPTTLVEARHTAFSNLSGGADTVTTKSGSLQAFVPHDAVVEDGDERFLPVSEVHRIAMFDIRMLNGDRNNENILVVRNPAPLPS